MNYLKQLLQYNPILISNHPLLAAIIFFLGSVILFSFSRERIAILCLFIAAMLLSYAVIHLDPFLNSWDERFHALVARNMAEHPFTPMLYVHPLIDYDFKNWTGNHIWMHKQPFFLWQMALSIKIFGPGEIAARLPSGLMLCLLIPVVYRMGQILFNERIGFMAALLLVTNNFILEHVSGKQQLEHNDIAFMFYVTLSIWAWLEYEKTNNKIWLISAGIFSGCGILIKWLTALLFYSGFGFYHLLIKKDLLRRETIFNLLYALLATFLVAMPWQIYTSLKYPAETHYEHSYNARHFFEVLEGHGGGPFFYLGELSTHYSLLAPFIFVGMGLAAFSYRKNKLALVLIFLIACFYLFFSLAGTKMTSFVLPMAPLCFLFIAFAIDRVLQFLKSNKVVRITATILLLIIMLFRNLDAAEMASAHWRNPGSEWGRFFQNTADNTLLYKSLNTALSDEYAIAFCNQFEEIDCMFYSGITSYSYLDESKFKQLKASGKKVAVFKNNLPEFVLKDTSVFILPFDYKTNKSGM